MKRASWIWGLAYLGFRICASSLAEDRFERNPIQYSDSKADNMVSLLQGKLDREDVKWSREKRTGYLRFLLKDLGIDTDSQTLVFSKTSLQGKLISPSRPRALYFNDNIYVGYVPGSHLLEVSVADTKLGAVFYTFDQNKRRLNRRVADCMACHGSSRTDYQPGHLLRSIFPAENGQPILRAGSRLTTHNSPYGERWGGWYVSGHGSQIQHMGNALAKETEDGTIQLFRRSSNETDLTDFFDKDYYLSPHSDIVAMMVQDHQVQMHNFLASANYQTRYALYDQQIIDKALGNDSGEMRASTKRRIANAGDKLLKYMLFLEEAQLTGGVKGTTDFAKKFSRRGPQDAKKRSLYQLDLKTRLLKYKCSYLIYSDAFDNLPVPMKEYLYRKLWDVLNGRDEDEAFVSLQPDDSRAILEILLETKKNLPAYWKKDS